MSFVRGLGRDVRDAQAEVMLDMRVASQGRNSYIEVEDCGKEAMVERAAASFLPLMITCALPPVYRAKASAVAYRACGKVMIQGGRLGSDVELLTCPMPLVPPTNNATGVYGSLVETLASLTACRDGI